MNVPFLDLKAQYKTLKQEIDNKILEVVESQKFILGSEVTELEKKNRLLYGDKVCDRSFLGIRCIDCFPYGFGNRKR